MYICTRSTKLKDFQFRLLHMTLITNKELMLFGKTTSDLCTFCKKDKEDIYNILLYCPISKNIWKYLQTFLHSKTGICIKFEDKDIILGNEFSPFLVYTTTYYFSLNNFFTLTDD